jgi:hypothetical protein
MLICLLTKLVLPSSTSIMVLTYTGSLALYGWHRITSRFEIMSCCLFTGSMKVFDWWWVATVEQFVYGMWKMTHDSHHCCMASHSQAVSPLAQKLHLSLGNCIVRALAVRQSYILLLSSADAPLFRRTMISQRTLVGLPQVLLKPAQEH